MSPLNDSESSLAPTLAPLCTGDADPRAVLDELARRGFRMIQLSAALPGMRPRDLDRSARRDLRARLRRRELEPVGVDLLIPAGHYRDPAQADRAADAVLAAVEFAADLGAVPLTVNLPEGAPNDLLEAIRGRADVTGVPIADLGAFGEVLGTGIDPAAVLAKGGDPARLASAAAVVNNARFSDAADGLRVPPGEGDLDVMGYRLALETRGYTRAVTADLRYLPEPWTVLEQSQAAWRQALGGAGGLLRS